MADALRRADEIEEAAQERARAIVASAEEAALRARADAHRRIEETGSQFNELLRLKDSLLETMRGVVSDFEHAIARVERGEPLFAGEAPAAAAPARTELPPPAAPRARIEAEAPAQVEVEQAPPPLLAPEPEPVEEPRFVAEQPPPPPVPEYVEAPVDAAPLPEPELEPEPAPEPEPAAAVADEQIFETRVELDAGPFSDFASLSAFERALAQLPKMDDVYVRRLADDRALIELTLSEPSPLLAAMRDSLPYELDVRSANRTKLVVNVYAQSTAGMH